MELSLILLCTTSLCCLSGLLPLGILWLLLNKKRQADEKPATTQPAPFPFKQTNPAPTEIPLETMLTTLVTARGTESRDLARRVIKRLTPETAPEALATLWEAWQTACANPQQDWRWSEAGVNMVVSAFPQAAFPLLANWIDLSVVRAVDFPKASWLALGLRTHREDFSPDVRDHLYYVPQRLLGAQNGPKPNVKQAEKDANLDALAHWTLSDDPYDYDDIDDIEDENLDDEKIRDKSFNTARRMVEDGRVTFVALFSALLSAWRHVNTYHRARDRRDDFAKRLQNLLRTHAPDQETARQQVFMGMADPDDEVRLLLAPVLAGTPELFKPADVERFLYDEFHSVSYQLMKYFEQSKDGAVIQRALGKAQTRMYAAQVICHWNDNSPNLLSQFPGLEPALRIALKSELESKHNDWSRLNWILKAVIPIGKSPEMLELVLPIMTYYEPNTRSRATEAASAIASHLPPMYQKRVRKAIEEYYTIECADCHHRFDGWGGSYRTGITLVCPKCKAPMIRYHLGWEWLGGNHALNHYKRRPSIMPYDAE